MIRVLDILLSLTALIVLAPILVPISAILSITGESQIFYLQERVGKYGGKFYLLKFATMLKNSPNIGTGNLTLFNDDRILPFGKILRRTKINELPQLINVLLGQMSLIGPRPLTYDMFELYEHSIQEKISEVRPGLSGIGSIIFRSEDVLLRDQSEPKIFYKTVIAPYKGKLETWFVDNYGFTMYIKCIIATILVVLFPRFLKVNLFFHGMPDLPAELRDVQRL